MTTKKESKKTAKKTAKKETKKKLSRAELERIAGGGATLNLTVHGLDPALRAYWADEPRIGGLLNKGYRFCSPEEIDGVGGTMAVKGFRDANDDMGDRVMRKNKGTPLYLMVIDRDRYNQIQAYKQEQVDELDNQIFNRDGDGFYTPNEAKR